MKFKFFGYIIFISKEIKFNNLLSDYYNFELLRKELKIQDVR